MQFVLSPRFAPPHHGHSGARLALQLIGLIVVMFALSGFLAAATSTGGPGPEFTIAAPVSFHNLTVFPLLGRGSTDLPLLDGLVTLDQALETEAVVIHETGNVNELMIENRGDRPVFVQAGDIVKGGRQDRVLGTDLLLTPNSKPVPIGVYCVEAGRWQARGEEPAAHFVSARETLPHPSLKRAARIQKDQNAVWAAVAGIQTNLESSEGVASDGRSPSSLQLTLENGALETKTQPYVEALSAAFGKHQQAVGFAYAVNGNLRGVELYAGTRLFSQSLPRLLRAAAVEAVIDHDDWTQQAPPSADSVLAQWNSANDAAVLEERATDEMIVFEKRTDRLHLLDNKTTVGESLHRSLMVVEPEGASPAPPPEEQD